MSDKYKVIVIPSAIRRAIPNQQTIIWQEQGRECKRLPLYGAYGFRWAFFHFVIIENQVGQVRCPFYRSEKEKKVRQFKDNALTNTMKIVVLFTENTCISDTIMWTNFGFFIELNLIQDMSWPIVAYRRHMVT